MLCEQPCCFPAAYLHNIELFKASKNCDRSSNITLGADTLTCHRGCWRDYLILKKVILEEKHAHFSRPFIHKPLDSLQTVFRNCCADLLFCLSIDFVHLFFLTSPGACISTTNPLRALTLTCLDCRLINKPQMYKLNLKNLLSFLSIPGLQWLLCPFSAPFSL